MSSRYDTYIYDFRFLDFLQKKKRDEEMTQRIYGKSCIALISEVISIHESLTESLRSMKMAEYFYYEAKQDLVDEMRDVMDTQNYQYGRELSDNLDTCIEEIKRVCRKDLQNVTRLLELTGVTIRDIDREYVFGLSANRTEMSAVTGIKMIQQFLGYH
jgi:hypothetical protein